MDVILQFPRLSPSQQQAILDGPAAVPPEGIEPNLNRPGNRSALAITISVICMLLVTVSVLGRAYSRLFLLKKVRLEDYLGFAAFAGYAGMAWAFYSQLHYGGFFVHQHDIRFRDFQNALYAAVMLTIIYSVTMICAKTAILLEWMHIFVPNRSRNAFFWGSCIMIVVNILLYCSAIVAEAMACIPLATIWEPWLTGKCIDKKSLDVTTAYFNLVIDFFILLLPQRVIWSLQMTKSKKIGVSVIFSFGIITIVCATGRVYANHVLPYIKEGDSNYGLAAVYLWSFAEVSCALLVFNVPALPKAFVDIWLGSRIVAGVRSWTHLSSYKANAAKANGASPIWPDANNNARPGMYPATDGHSHIELTGLERAKGRSSRTPYYHDQTMEDGGIVCFTEFEAREDVAPKGSNGPGGDVISRQHPWM